MGDGDNKYSRNKRFSDEVVLQVSGLVLGALIVFLLGVAVYIAASLGLLR